jgi:ABC-type transport system involved in cytochrome bd biosynthesis fused ATPase/permease subunit
MPEERDRQNQEHTQNQEQTQYQQSRTDLGSGYQKRNLARSEHSEQWQLEQEERRIALAQREAAVNKAVQFIYYLVGALGILLALRIFLRLFGANPQNQFAIFIYKLSHPFIAPFSNLFQNPTFGENNVFEINVLIAIGAYGLVTWLVVRLIYVIWMPPPD